MTHHGAPAAAAPDLAVPVVVYTDGACINNPGAGGWAYVMRRGEKVREDFGHVHQTTNNRMEMQAVIQALTVIREGSSVVVHTDSQYVQRGISEWLPKWKAKGWRTSAGKPVLNADLWIQLERLAGAHQVAWRWVRGHSGDPGNERADALATRAARAGR